MRKVVVAEFLSLDGVMEEPAWTVKYWNDETAKFKFDLATRQWIATIEMKS